VPFFEKYKLKLRVYDRFYQTIDGYDPPVANFNNRPMHCLVDGDARTRSYHDLQEPRAQGAADGRGEEHKLTVGTDYKVKEREPVKHRMITHVDDILGVLKEVAGRRRTEAAIFLIHEHDNLEELLWQLHDRGHTPRVDYQAGMITSISMFFNKHRIVIKCQQLVKSED
jgi:hypothetical protein